MLSGDLLIVEYIILLHSIFISILIETTIKFIHSKVIHQDFISLKLLTPQGVKNRFNGIYSDNLRQ